MIMTDTIDFRKAITLAIDIRLLNKLAKELSVKFFDASITKKSLT